MWLWKLVIWQNELKNEIWWSQFQSPFFIPTVAGCEALQHLAEMIPTFCYTYPGLEHMEEMEMSSLKLVLIIDWMNCLMDMYFCILTSMQKALCDMSRHSQDHRGFCHPFVAKCDARKEALLELIKPREGGTIAEKLRFLWAPCDICSKHRNSQDLFLVFVFCSPFQDLV